MQYGYDENGNVVSTRTRNAQIFATTYDALNRPTLADNPTNVGDVTYSYDLLGRPLTASLAGGRSTTLTWDALNRQLTETDSVLGTTSMRYDLAGRRIRLTWPDAFYVTYDYDLTDAMTAILGNGTAAYTAYGYDNLGRRASITRGNGITTTYGYDPASRLTSLAHNLPGSSNDQTLTFTYNPAGQIVTRTGSNAAYDAPAPATGSDSYPINGLNQSGAGGLMLPYDLKGNLLGDATQSYTYDQANRLTSHTAGGVTATLTWDPLSRLAEMVGAQGARYLYDGQQIAGIATNASPTLINRIVHGPWPDEVAVVYPTSSTPLWNLQDNLGSTIAITTNTGAPTNILAYDENGVPKSTNTGRFQYTGQLWLPDFGVYHYKARAYNPTLGRFLQTDPMGYEAGMNLYGYVGGDPVNWTDPFGLQAEGDTTDLGDTNEVTGCGRGKHRVWYGCVANQTAVPSGPSGSSSGPEGGGEGPGAINRGANNQSEQCSISRTKAAATAVVAKALSDKLALLAAGGAIIGLAGFAAEPYTAGGSTFMLTFGGGVAADAGAASLISGGISAALEAYSSGSTRAFVIYGGEATIGVITGRLTNLQAVRSVLPESFRTAIDQAVGLVAGLNEFGTKNPCFSGF